MKAERVALNTSCVGSEGGVLRQRHDGIRQILQNKTSSNSWKCIVGIFQITVSCLR